MTIVAVFMFDLVIATVMCLIWPREWFWCLLAANFLSFVLVHLLRSFFGKRL